MPRGSTMQLREIQKLVWENKVAKGFNTTDLNLEFAFTHAELSEAFEASRKQPDNLGDELADVLLFLVSIAEMRGVDRKSTRLNSSHVSISYAVFCLKK